jgi:hypothetical protein
MVRDALGQGAATTPYTFVPIRYPHGSNWNAIGDGMAALDADPAFNAGISWAAQSLAMDGDGAANSAHMGDADAAKLGENLAADMADALRPLATGDSAPPAEPPPETQPPAPATLSAGEGPDELVLEISQDAYEGDAEYTVSVDGTRIGGTFAASAWRSAGQSDTLTVRGDWGPGEHRVEVTFLNDRWDGTADADRNLHLDGATYNGEALAGAAAALMSTGSAGFVFSEAEAPEPEPPPAAEEGTDGTDLFDVTAAGGVFAGKGGRDLYVFEAGDGRVEIQDFEPGTDKLVFVGFDEEDVSAAESTEGGASGLLVTYGDGGGAFLAGVSALGSRDLTFG